MTDKKLGAAEARFADLIWEKEPLSTSELTALCQRELDWKRTTTYTVLKRLSDRGLFQNDGGVVTSLLSREEFYGAQSEKFVDEAFHGSLPAFIAAFTSRKRLSAKEAAEIARMIDEFQE